MQRNFISVYVHVSFYMYLLTFFPYCVSYLGKYTHSSKFVPSTDKAKEERKSKLLELTHLLGTISRKSKAASSRGKFSPSGDYPQSPPCKKIQTSKKIQVGWQHYGDNEKRYVYDL